MTYEQDIASGARRVEEKDHLTSGLTNPVDRSSQEIDEGTEASTLETKLGEMTLSMFEQGQSVRVRVGSAFAASELYEFAFESADEANTALLDEGILQADQVPDKNAVVGTGIKLHGLTAEQLLRAGLKRHNSPTM